MIATMLLHNAHVCSVNQQVNNMTVMTNTPHMMNDTNTVTLDDGHGPASQRSILATLPLHYAPSFHSSAATLPTLPRWCTLRSTAPRPTAALPRFACTVVPFASLTLGSRRQGHQRTCTQTAKRDRPTACPDCGSTPRARRCTCTRDRLALPRGRDPQSGPMCAWPRFATVLTLPTLPLTSTSAALGLAVCCGCCFFSFGPQDRKGH